MNFDTLRPDTARLIVETVGGHGTPPEWGFQFFTAGLEDYLQVIEDDYLREFVAQGGASFKMVVGAYGGGKTHFLYNIREMAWKYQYVVSYVSLRHDESPFHKMDRVYRAIAASLMPPLTPDEVLAGQEKGIGAFLKTWYQREADRLAELGLDGEQLHAGLAESCRSGAGELEGASYAMAIRQAFMALVEERPDDFDSILQWLTADGFDRHVHRQYHILRPLDRGVAFAAIRSMVQWIRNLGYRGLVILLDEAEQIPSLSSKQREIMLSNLRELIDECGQSSFRNVMVFYAVPGEGFLDGHANVYEALKQRVGSVFDFYNPSGVKIYLEKLVTDPVRLLTEIGGKLLLVFQHAYGLTLEPGRAEKVVALAAEEAYEQRFGDIGYKRLFVQGVVRGFQYLRRKPDATVDTAWMRGLMGGSA